MLQELHIKNFAIINELHLTLEPGFNILTGETGAGKSILIDAVTLLLGGRADTTFIRLGAERARVEGFFLLDPEQQHITSAILESEGLEGNAADELWLGRELRKSGRTVARINGRVVSLSILRHVAEGLVDVHGQTEHLSLLRVKEHLNLLDRFAGLESIRAEAAEQVKQLQKVQRELKHLRQSERDRMQRMDLLRFQIEEIHSANLVIGEKAQLETELVRLTNVKRLANLASAFLALFEEEQDESPAILDLLGQGQRTLTGLARIDATLAPQVETLEAIGYQIDDLTRAIRDYLGDIEFNPQRLTWIEEHISLLRQLERKYGGDSVAILAYADHAITELESLENSDEHIAALQDEESELSKTCAVVCSTLSQKRQGAAVRLSAMVEEELNDLRMQGARLGVAFRWQYHADGLPTAQALPHSLVVTRDGPETSDTGELEKVTFDKTGFDHIEFLIAPNVGEGLKPMTKIASGGETARLMLALKTVLSRADRTPTLIFDEIDQGIGGRIGAVVGAKLWRLTADRGHKESVTHQVLCITHLPQLASFGDVHFHVAKQIKGERTTTQVLCLDKAQRVSELAQMLGTQGKIAHQGAVEMLKQAETLKQVDSKAILW